MYYNPYTLKLGEPYLHPTIHSKCHKKKRTNHLIFKSDHLPLMYMVYLQSYTDQSYSQSTSDEFFARCGDIFQHYKNRWSLTRVYSTRYCRHASNLTRVTSNTCQIVQASKMDTRMKYTCPIGHVYLIRVSIWTRV
jgi:hypothetical protein